ncbi:MAG: hypothetical protein ACYDCL_12190 [Myxococcales bacterium]
MAVACSATPSPSDAGSRAGPDAGPDAGSTGASPGVCTPAPGQTGNSLNVGAYCTKGNGQCANYGGPAGNNLACSIDLDPSGGNFCILLPCSQDSDCGPDACCTGDPCNPIHACVPIQCLSDGGVCPPIPGCDGG